MSKYYDQLKLNQMIQARRNDCIQLIRYSSRVVNEVRFGENEGKTHKDLKEKLCKELEAEGKHYITEAIFEKGMRADILILDSFTAVEIAVSEDDESLEKKRSVFKKLGLRMEVVRAKKRRNKTNHFHFGDIPRAKDGRFYKKQKVHLCIACLKKRASLPDMPCEYCVAVQTRKS